MKRENILVQVVFITLDHEHDTNWGVKKIFRKIDVNFIGLIWKVQDIEQLADQFKVILYIKNIRSNFVYLI